MEGGVWGGADGTEGEEEGVAGEEGGDDEACFAKDDEEHDGAEGVGADVADKVVHLLLGEGEEGVEEAGEEVDHGGSFIREWGMGQTDEGVM